MEGSTGNVPGGFTLGRVLGAAWAGEAILRKSSWETTQRKKVQEAYSSAPSSGRGGVWLLSALTPPEGGARENPQADL